MKKRWIAGGVAATVLIAGLGIRELSETAVFNEETVQEQNEEKVSAVQVSEITGFISASGTTQAGADYQYLSLSLPGGRVGLEVEEVYVEAGDTVEEGQALFKISEESLSQVEARLQSQVSSAQTALSQAQLSYESGLLQAESQKTSNLSLKSSATVQLNQTKTSLDKAVTTASETLTEAQEIIEDYPSQIKTKESELEAAEDALEDLQEEQKKTQNEWTALSLANQQIKEEYVAQKEAYETMQSILQSAKAYVESAGMSDSGANDSETTNPEMSESNMETTNSTETMNDSAEADSDQTSAADSSASNDEETAAIEFFLVYIEKLEAETESCRQTYETIRKEYEAAAAEEKALQETLTRQTEEITEYETQIQQLTQEISQMESSLEKAESNLAQYQINYEEAIVNQLVKGVSAQNTYNQTMVTYNHAYDIYKLAVAKLDDTLQAAKDACTEAEENLALFQETFADGILRSTQAGYISSVTYSAGDVMQTGMPVVAYYNGSKITVSVSVDQADISEIHVGDTVNVQISSASRVQEGIVTQVDAQTDSDSISHVTYTVEITIENADGRLSSGETAQILFTDSSRSEEDEDE